MRTTHCAVLGALLFSVSPALAADAPSSTSPSTESDGALRSAAGFHIGAGAGTARLGKSFDLSLEYGLRKRLGSFVLGGALRPHYERFAFGESDVSGCTDASMCGPSVALRSQLSAHAVTLEVPFILEAVLGQRVAFRPFVGVAPAFSYLRATESRQGLIPTGADNEQSISRGFLTVGAFGGTALALSDKSAVVVRVGYRFAPEIDDLPGGSAAMRGVFASVGYRVEL